GVVFLRRPSGSFAAAGSIITRLALVVAGNYGWLNWATILLACAGSSDSFFRWIAGGPFPEWGWTSVIDTVTGAEAAGSGQQAVLPLWWAILIAVFVAWQAWLNVPALRNLFSPAQLMNASFNRWGLGNAYGAFGSMTETREESSSEGWSAPDEGGSGEGSSGEDDPGEDGGAVGEADLGDGGGTAGEADGWREYRFKGKPGD